MPSDKYNEESNVIADAIEHFSHRMYSIGMIRHNEQAYAEIIAAFAKSVIYKELLGELADMVEKLVK